MQLKVQSVWNKHDIESFEKKSSNISLSTRTYLHVTHAVGSRLFNNHNFSDFSQGQTKNWKTD